MSMSAPLIHFPERNATIDRPAASGLVNSLRSWMAESTDRVFALDGLWQTIGPDASTAEHADVAASFLAHQAIGTRVAELGTALSESRDGAKNVVELCHQHVSASDGSPIAANLHDACVLLDAILDRAEESLQRTTQSVHESVRLRSAINGDLVVAESLAQRLGDQVRHINELSVRASAVMTRHANGVGNPELASNIDSDELARLATEIATVRSSLEAADAERRRLIASWSSLPARIERMAAQEAIVRELRQRCEDKVRPLPKLAVPSLAALAAPMPIEQLELRPWPAVEPECRTYLNQLDRVQAALDEVQRRYEAPLRERDELRGLVQAFHDKAGESGLAEHTELDPAYRAAVTELWSAPCDLRSARTLVDNYLFAVNSITNGETARNGGGSGS